MRAARALADRAPVRTARRVLRELRPRAVLGAGGYVAGPVGVALVLTRIPLVLMEADSHLGLTNRLLAPVARRVCLAFPLAGRGPPLPRHGAPRTRAGDRPSRGAPAIRDPGRRAVRAGVRWLPGRALDQPRVGGGVRRGRFHVLHAAGARDLPDLTAPGPHYDLRGYITGFGEAILASDLVVARSGGSIFEVAAHARPMVLIPYPFAAADHQAENARYFERLGAAVVIPDGELTGPRLAQEVGRLLGDPSRLAAMGNAAAGLARPDAAQEIAAEVLAAARGGRPRRRAALKARLAGTRNT